MDQVTPDHIRDAINARAEQLGLSAYAISAKCDGSPTEESIRRYLVGRTNLGSHHLAAVCRALRLRLRPTR